MVVSQPTAAKGAACMNVHAGYKSDPEDLPGLAHYLEHMLFMGSKKFSLENDYHAFAKRHGGKRNGYTQYNNTCFSFDVNSSKLNPMLDRFAQFFIEPIFNPSSLERELKAV